MRPEGESRRRARLHLREFLADSLTPLAAYRRLAASSRTRFLFESITGGEQVSRYSFLGGAPWGVYRLYRDRLEIEQREGSTRFEGNPLQALRGELLEIEGVDHSLPLTGGFVGFFAYDFVRMLERLPSTPPDVFDLPIALLARFDSLVIFDHAQQRVVAVANEVEGQVDRRQALDRLDELSAILTSSGEGNAVELSRATSAPLPAATPNLDGEAFRDRVRRAKRYIAAGDIFQAVLARRWRLAVEVEPLALYRALRMVNPSPYMVLLEAPDVALVGASPEMLVRTTSRRIETRPIAGTRPRSPDPVEDRRLAEELIGDAKERAEHIMLVDLGRNDLGRVAEAGSIDVPSFMEIERYSHVMHLVSSVVGRLAEDLDALDALFACFPAGTVCGAPKIRAMEIIDELEPECRGPYAGAVGYLSYSGDMDTCITIRTLVVRRGETSFTAGAGIVADSDPDAEVLETENKAAAMLKAVKIATVLAASADRPGEERE